MALKLIVTHDEVGYVAASYIRKRIEAFAPTEQRPFVIAFPTGGTAVSMYASLVRFCREGKLSFKNVVSFNLDEYVGLAQDDALSYHYYMRKNLFDHVDMPEQNINIPDGNAPDLEKFCLAYEEKIKSYGGIELFLGGVGQNGHIAFNEPGSDFNSKTHVVTLQENTLRANARFFNGDVNAVPKRAVTMGLGTIRAAREVIIMAIGAKKAQAVQRAFDDKPDVNWSITALASHPAAYVLADEGAAGLVSGLKFQDCGACCFRPPKK